MRALLAALVLFVCLPATGHASVTAPARGTTIQATEAVNLRSGPDTSYAVVAVAASGDTAVALGRASGEFVQVYYRGHAAWTHRAYWNAVPGLWVNGHRLSADQENAVRWIAANTINRVEGTLSEKLTTVSRVTWWSLKEGVLSQALTAVHRFSNCDDTIYDPLYHCGTVNWQVGIGGVYMGNASGRTAEVEATAVRLYPGWTVGQVLAHTANYAGYPAGSGGHNAIVNSGGNFRLSWLLRNHGVGFTFNELYMSSCLANAPYWCFGTWDDALLYAPSQSGINLSIADLRAILYAIRPI